MDWNWEKTFSRMPEQILTPVSRRGTFGRWRGMTDWWFRVLGVGFSFTDHRKRPALFSERTGSVLRIHVGPFCLKWLGPLAVLITLSVEAQAQKSIKTTGPKLSPAMETAADRATVGAAAAFADTAGRAYAESLKAFGAAVTKCTAAAKDAKPPVTLPDVKDADSSAAYLTACKGLGAEIPVDPLALNRAYSAISGLAQMSAQADVVRMRVALAETQAWRLPAALEALAQAVDATAAACEQAHLPLPPDAAREARRRLSP